MVASRSVVLRSPGRNRARTALTSLAARWFAGVNPRGRGQGRGRRAGDRRAQRAAAGLSARLPRAAPYCINLRAPARPPGPSHRTPPPPSARPGARVLVGAEQPQAELPPGTGTAAAGDVAATSVVPSLLPLGSRHPLLPSLPLSGPPIRPPPPSLLPSPAL